MNTHKNPWDYPFTPLTAAQYERAAQMWADSKNTAEIASELFVSAARVFNTMGHWMPRARALAAVRRAVLDAAAQSDGINPPRLSVVRDHVEVQE